MSGVDNVLEPVLAELERVFAPLITAVDSSYGRRALFAPIGWDGVLLVDAAVEGAIANVATLLDTARHLAGKLDDFGQLLEAIQAVGKLIRALDQLGEAARRGALSTFADPKLVAELAEDLLALLVCTYLIRHHPWAYLTAIGATLIDPAAPPRTALTLPSGKTLREAVPRFALRFDNLPKLVQDPVGHLERLHFDGNVNAAGAKKFSDRVLAEVARTLVLHGVDASYGFPTALATELGMNPNDEFVERVLSLGFRLPPVHAAGSDAVTEVRLGIRTGLIGNNEQGGPALVLVPRGSLEVDQPVGGWTLIVKLSGTSGGVAIGPRGVTLGSGGSPSGRIELGLAKGGARPAFLLGASSGTRVELGGVTFKAGVALSASGARFDLFAGVDHAEIVIAAGDGDGFLRHILPRNGVRIPFELGIGFASPDRLYFSGGAGLDVELPVDIDLFGILKVPVIGLRMALALEQNKPPSLHAAATATVEVALGPFFATVEGMGLGADLTFPPSGANLGPSQVAIGFEPPRGIGMRIKAGPVIGGGRLYLDAAKGEYAGVLQVKVGPVGLTAIGLLNTKMPDGSDGFSLVLIICADFPVIQLGYGFTLNGAGGILGVNRSVDVPTLQDGVRRGALDSLLFPKDAAGNARQIVKDVGAIFPPTADQFVIGPMVKLGWGVFIRASIGVLIEFPRFTISLLGLVEVGLPTVDSPVILLRLGVAGILDPGRGELSIDGTLQGSRITVFAINGDMALRLRWKGNAMFAMAAGGFHPRFEPPAGFPALKRLTIALADRDNPRLRLESYFAITPATVQFGARLDAYASIDLSPLGFFEVEADLGFDTLIRLSPLSFEIDLGGHASLKRNHEAFCSVDLALHLSGPTPWHALGKATVHFFGDHTIAFEHRTGSLSSLPPPPAIDLAAAVRAALGDAHSWAAVPPADAPVRLREVSGAVVCVHPAAALVARQSVAPLDRDLEKAGTSSIAGARRITLDAVLAGPDSSPTALAAGHAVSDLFAPSQFFELSDDQKLTGPAFESLPSGAELGQARIAWGSSAALSDSVADIVIDAGARRAAAGVQQPFVAAVVLDAPRRAGELVSRGRGVLGVAIKPTTWAVVQGDQAAHGVLVARSRGHATWIDATRSSAPTLFVVPTDEVAP